MDAKSHKSSSKKIFILLKIRETYHKIVFYYDAINVAMINVETDSSEF